MDLLERTLVCSVCRKDLPETSFHLKNDGKKRGRQSLCRPCMSTYKREKGINRNTVLKRYGMTQDEYGALLAKQGGVCAACKGAQTVVGNFDIDHDHVTGAVRGLLCRSCNVILGHAKDDPARLYALAVYLEISRGSTS